MAVTIQGIEQLAALSVGRGCRYAMLSIFILAIAMSSSIPGACATGASLFLLVSAILTVKVPTSTPSTIPEHRATVPT
jgi:hypothetical protein